MLADAGLLGVAVGEDNGGLGLGAIEVALVLEQLGRAVAPLPLLDALVSSWCIDTHGTEAQRERGLMDRTTVPPHTGMIFVFDGDEPVEFWMKDTLVSLDMVFVAADGSVRRVYADVPVLRTDVDDDAIPREGATAKYVIELHAGDAAKDGIAAGVRLDLHDLPSSM